VKEKRSTMKKSTAWEEFEIGEPLSSAVRELKSLSQCGRCYECSFFNTSSELIIPLKFLNVCMGIIAANVK
jgi:hypothetical protein